MVRTSTRSAVKAITAAQFANVPTIKRDWRKARAFLFDALQT